MENRLAIVTGTSSGLGACVARQLLEQGFRVVGVARRPAAVTGPGYEHAALDLADGRAAEAYFTGPFLAAHDPGSFQRVALVNNAGTIAPVASIPSAGLAALHASLLLNAALPTWLMGFLAARSGAARLRIVNISSGAATSAYPGWGAYCMGKAALRIASQVMALEAEEVPGLHGRDLAVVSYAPGVVDTPMQADVRASSPGEFPRLRKFLDLKESGKLVDPELPAAEIVKLLLRDDLPRFTEMRFGA